jgi:hypothetical protein
MSRRKDIAALVPLKALLFDLSEDEARRELEKLSTPELRRRRSMIEHACRPKQDPKFCELMARWDEIDKKAGKILAEFRARNPPKHSTL